MMGTQWKSDFRCPRGSVPAAIRVFVFAYLSSKSTRAPERQRAGAIEEACVWKSNRKAVGRNYGIPSRGFYLRKTNRCINLSAQRCLLSLALSRVHVGVCVCVWHRLGTGEPDVPGQMST